MIEVEVPKLGTIEFPDDMPQDQIEGHINDYLSRQKKKEAFAYEKGQLEKEAGYGRTAEGLIDLAKIGLKGLAPLDITQTARREIERQGEQNLPSLAGYVAEAVKPDVGTIVKAGSEALRNVGIPMTPDIEQALTEFGAENVGAVIGAAPELLLAKRFPAARVPVARHFQAEMIAGLPEAAQQTLESEEPAEALKGALTTGTLGLLPTAIGAHLARGPQAPAGLPTMGRTLETPRGARPFVEPETGLLERLSPEEAAANAERMQREATAAFEERERQAIPKPVEPKPELPVEKAKSVKEYITAVASRLNNTIATGGIHFEAEKALREKLGIGLEDPRVEYIEHGFLTNKGRFVDQEEAAIIARKANQLKQEPEAGILGTHDLKPSELKPAVEAKEAAELKAEAPTEVEPIEPAVEAPEIPAAEAPEPSAEIKVSEPEPEELSLEMEVPRGVRPSKVARLRRMLAEAESQVDRMEGKEEFEKLWDRALERVDAIKSKLEKAEKSELEAQKTKERYEKIIAKETEPGKLPEEQIALSSIPEPSAIEFETPEPNTPRSEQIERLAEEAYKIESALTDKYNKAKEEAEKAGYGTKRKESAESRQQKFREQLWELEKKNAPIHEQSRTHYLENLARTGDRAQRWAATIELLKRKAEKAQKDFNRLREEGKPREADLRYYRARALSEQAKKMSDEAYRTFVDGVTKELESLGATAEEAKFEGQQIANMQLSYPGMKSIAEAGLRMRAIEGSRTTQHMKAKADALRKEFGVIADTGLDNRLRNALPDEKRAEEILSEYRERYVKEKEETAAKEQAKIDKADKAQTEALEAANKIPENVRQWRQTNINGISIWTAIEGRDISLKSAPNYEFFYYHSGVGQWSIVEKSTGLAVGIGRTKGEAIAAAEERISKAGDKFPFVVKSGLEKAPPRPKIPTEVEEPAKPSLEPPKIEGMGGAVAEEYGRTATRSEAFERARKGDDSAFDDLDAQFRQIYPEPEEIARGGYDPNAIRTPAAFAEMFNKAFAARDFDRILNSIKATSDVSIWKPFLKDLFKLQATDPLAAQKAEWMRHVFNGTRPPDAVNRPSPRTAVPPQQPTPQPTAQPPPPPPPAPPPERIPVSPLSTGPAKSPYQIIEDFSLSIGKALRVLRLKKSQLGIYRPGSTTTAERFAGDLDTAAHELAGHWTDDRYGIGKPWIAPRTRSPYDSELAKFWIHGSVTPRSTLRYRRAEGIAEYIRAYVVNPDQARLEAPNFTTYFEKTLPDDALKSIQSFSNDVRNWAGADPLLRAGLNIQMEPLSLTERLWRGIRGRGFGFEINPIDRLRFAFDDPYHYAVKASKMMQELRGQGPIPAKDFELTARLLSTHDARMDRQFKEGLVPLRPKQGMVNDQLVVERSMDPVTNQPITLQWLLGEFDRKSNAAFKQDMRDASAFMVAQRTVEKATQLGREENVSGLGAGLMNDVQASQELLNRVAQDPAKQARLTEAARRYRLWADHNIQMLVDAGRLSPERARAIRDSNQQYVDMHRLSDEFEAANFQQRGSKIGTPRDVIRRFKGSTLKLDNVYSNLLEQTDAIQKESHRNLVMNNFVDGLRNIREMHGPELKDFDQFGRKVTSSDKNTIPVYKDGKAEYWQFAPEIYESLKGLGELRTNTIFSLITLPSKLARFMITRGPSFMIRNPLRDTFERAVNSRSGGKPWDIFQGYTNEELARYEVFGGGQFGNYIIDRHTWNREINKTMREMVKDPRNIVVSPLKLGSLWSHLGESSEKLGRIAEFRRAFDKAKKDLAKDHPNLTPDELDYNAALRAAGEARGLLDFAKAGVVMKYINQAIPFSNAGMRGLAKSVYGMYENPARYAMNWGLYVMMPTLAVMLWNRRDPETWKEYEQLPAYRRDFFWNLKAGDYWISIPKPHLLGVLSGGVERIVSRILGEKHAAEGFGKSLANALPVSNIAEASGPLKTFMELHFNRDTFRDRDIVPPYEKDLRLELRKGKAHASEIAKAIASTVGADPRNIDFILNSMGGWGNMATGFTRTNSDLTTSALRSTGLISEPPATTSTDVQWIMDYARLNGKLSHPLIKSLNGYRQKVFDSKDYTQKVAAAKKLRAEATKLRANIEAGKIPSMKPKLKSVNSTVPAPAPLFQPIPR